MANSTETTISPVLSRYGSLVADDSAFYSCAITPMEVTGWMHPERRHQSIFLAGPACDSPWQPGFFRTPTTSSTPFLIGFLAGSVLVQEKSAMTAVGLLGAKKGSHVLDLCAAPGNKTAQISMVVGETGLVVANDVSRPRLGVVHGTMDRLGLSNVMTTAHDARYFPVPPIGFDAVLADVPCSCEGTSRKHPQILSKSNEAERTRLINVQKQILARAIQCVKPGGRVVYSTCTYAPEENEAVVNWALNEAVPGFEVRLLDIAIPGFTIRAGVTSWGGESFDSSLSKCARIWPHENDSGGFFLAVLERTASEEGTLKSSAHGLETTSTPILTSEWPWQAHGFQNEDLLPWGTHAYSNKYNRLVRADGFDYLGLQSVSRGVAGLNLKSEYPKLSTPLTQKLGRFAQTNIAEIDPIHALGFFKREAIPAYDVRAGSTESNTFIVRMGGLSLGLASMNRQSGLLDSRFPKVWGGLRVSDRI